MTTLTIGNSYSQIEDCTPRQEKDLRELLSYSDNPNQQFYSNNYSKKYLISKKGEFPSGLLPLVQTYLESINAKVKTIDTRKKPKRKEGLFKLNLKGILQPYPEQIKAAEMAERYHRGTIVMPTGMGKSVTIALIIEMLQVKTLIIVPTVELKHQLTQTLTKLFGQLGHISIENIDSTKLPKLTDFDCLIIDEAHHTGARTYRKLNKGSWNNIYYRFFLTATPFRSNDNEQLLLESIISQVIYEVTYQEAVYREYIVPIEAYYLDIPCTKKVKGRDWKSFYSQDVVNNEERNNAIIEVLVKLYKDKTPTLCLVKEIKHGKNLSSDGAFPFMSGQDSESRQYLKLFNDEKLKVLIGTTGVLGEGIDSRPAEWVIIAGMGKSRNQFMQSVGRGVRRFKDKKSCKVILIRYPNHKWSQNHYNEQVKILLEEYGIKPQKLVL